MKRKASLNYFLVCLSVFTMVSFLDTGHEYWAILSAFTLGIAITLTVINTHKENTISQPDLLIQGHHSFLTHAEAMQWCMRGYGVTKTYNKRKYKWFGQMIYYVELMKPKLPESPPIEDENEILAYGRKFHEAVFNGTATIEPTDEELEQQERYEELAERKRKRENNNTQNL